MATAFASRPSFVLPLFLSGNVKRQSKAMVTPLVSTKQLEPCGLQNL